MLTEIHPKLPMRHKDVTKRYYLDQLGFEELSDYGNYLILKKSGHHPKSLSLLKMKTEIHPNGDLQTKPWGQREFSVLDPDHNLLTFGQSI